MPEKSDLIEKRKNERQTTINKVRCDTKIEDRSMINENHIDSFLHYGYLPFPSEKQNERIVNWNNQLQNTSVHLEDIIDEAELMEQGILALKKVFTNIESGTHILPLSGGLDSRTVLGGLLYAGLEKQIIAVTFGTPGTFDFEIGQLLANKLGLRHEIFDFTKLELDQEELEKIAASDNSWTFLYDRFYNYQLCKYFGKDCIYWSGFLGDAVSGAHLPEIESLNWLDAKRYFAHRNRFVKSMKLTSQTYNPVNDLPERPLINSKYINFDLQLDLFIRQEFYIRKTVTNKDYDYRTPFQDPNWINFILSVPNNFYKNQYLYKKVILKAFPDLFDMPTTNNFGFPLNKNKNLASIRRLYEKIRLRIFERLPQVGDMFPVYKNMNYINFNNALRHRSNFKKTVYHNIQNLKLRKLIDWLDFDLLWGEHQEKIKNHGNALMLLSALEINLRAIS